MEIGVELTVLHTFFSMQILSDERLTKMEELIVGNLNDEAGPVKVIRYVLVNAA
jgi:hypothetical protein